MQGNIIITRPRWSRNSFACPSSVTSFKKTQVRPDWSALVPTQSSKGSLMKVLRVRERAENFISYSSSISLRASMR